MYFIAKNKIIDIFIDIFDGLFVDNNYIKR